MARRLLFILLPLLLAVIGCADPVIPYGQEDRLSLPRGTAGEVWAVAPALDLSGENQIDPLLQADILFRELQTVKYVTALPVNRAAEVYAALGIRQVQSQTDADLVLGALGATGLVVPTITIYDPYDPPKVGATLTLFRRSVGFGPTTGQNARDAAAAGVPAEGSGLPAGSAAGFAPGTVQATGVFDATNGSIRAAVFEYAYGRYDPYAASARREYLLSADRYCGWVYNELLGDLIKHWRAATAAS